MAYREVSRVDMAEVIRRWQREQLTADSLKDVLSHETKFASIWTSAMEVACSIAAHRCGPARSGLPHVRRPSMHHAVLGHRWLRPPDRGGCCGSCSHCRRRDVDGDAVISEVGERPFQEAAVVAARSSDHASSAA